jgi:hypothetical protein
MVDWRLQNQETYLKGAVLFRRAYTPARQEWDHDHCEFCRAKFSIAPDDKHVGYTTADEYWWVCDECFRDFSVQFEWRVC